MAVRIGARSTRVPLNPLGQMLLGSAVFGDNPIPGLETDSALNPDASFTETYTWLKQAFHVPDGITDAVVRVSFLLGCTIGVARAKQRFQQLNLSEPSVATSSVGAAIDDLESYGLEAVDVLTRMSQQWISESPDDHFEQLAQAVHSRRYPASSPKVEEDDEDEEVEELLEQAIQDGNAEQLDRLVSQSYSHPRTRELVPC